MFPGNKSDKYCNILKMIQGDNFNWVKVSKMEHIGSFIVEQKTNISYNDCAKFSGSKIVILNNF